MVYSLVQIRIWTVLLVSPEIGESATVVHARKACQNFFSKARNWRSHRVETLRTARSIVRYHVFHLRSRLNASQNKSQVSTDCSFLECHVNARSLISPKERCRRTRALRISLNWLHSRRIIFIIKSSSFENVSERVSSRLLSLRFVAVEICIGVLIEKFQISFSASGRLYCSRTKPRRFYFFWYSSVNNKNVRISSSTVNITLREIFLSPLLFYHYNCG